MIVLGLVLSAKQLSSKNGPLKGQHLKIIAFAVIAIKYQTSDTAAIHTTPIN
jgi:hypothetical protein